MKNYEKNYEEEIKLAMTMVDKGIADSITIPYFRGVPLESFTKEQLSRIIMWQFIMREKT